MAQFGHEGTFSTVRRGNMHKAEEGETKQRTSGSRSGSGIIALPGNLLGPGLMRVVESSLFRTAPWRGAKTKLNENALLLSQRIEGELNVLRLHYRQNEHPAILRASHRQRFETVISRSLPTRQNRLL